MALIPSVLGAVSGKPARAAEQVVVLDHTLVLRLDPGGHRLLAEDRIDVTPWRASFLPLVLSPTFEILEVTSDGVALSLPPRDPTGRFVVLLAPGQREVTIRYRGRVGTSVQPSPDLGWVRGDTTSGVIGPEGVYLDEGTGWVPLPAVAALSRFRVRAYVPAPLLVVTQGGVPQRTEQAVRGFREDGDDIVPQTDPSLSGGQVSTWNVLEAAPGLPSEGLWLSAGEFVEEARDRSGLRIATYFRKEHAAAAPIWLDALEEVARRYAPLLGPYPHAKFDVVENFFQTGYGMPGTTVLGDRVIAYVTENARRTGGKIPPGYLDHEYVHGWYGNGVLVDYDRGNWCEGLTSYLSNYLAVEMEGPQEAAAARLRILEQYAISVGPEQEVALRNWRQKEEAADDEIGYGKASLLFHMVRRRLGDERFFEVLRAVTRENLGRRLAWDDWLAAFAGASPNPQAFQHAFSPFVELPGLPPLALKTAVATPIHPADPDGPHEVEVVLEGGGNWRVTVPLRLQLRAPSNPVEPLDLTVAVNGETGWLRTTVPYAPTAVTLDPDAHVLRRLPDAALPPCLNRTLAWPRPGTIYVDAPEGVLDELAKSLARQSGWSVTRGAPPPPVVGKTSPPVVILQVLAEGPEEPALEAGGQRLTGKNLALLSSQMWEGSPRTRYVAATVEAAAAALRLPFYGWDTWIFFRSGRPVLRGTERHGSPALTRSFGRQGLAQRVQTEVTELASLPRAVDRSRPPALAHRLGKDLGMPALLPQDEVSNPFAFEFLGDWRAESVVLRYAGGHRKGEIHHPHLRPLVISGSRTTADWVSVGSGPGEAHVVDVAGQGLSEILAAARRAADARAALVLLLADATAWEAAAPLLDHAGQVTTATNEALSSSRRRPDPLPPWLSARRARAGVADLSPLSCPVLMALPEALPPLGPGVAPQRDWIEEMALVLEVQRDWLVGRNVVGWLPPTSARPRAQSTLPPVLLLTAHYDTLPPTAGGAVRPGADDNASGVACLLALAKNLAPAWEERFDREWGLVIAFTDAEEWGLLGSRALVEQLAPHVQVRAVINVDAVGRALSRPVHLVGESHHPDWAARVRIHLLDEGLKIGETIDRFAFAHGSDHWPFHEAGIPALTLWASDYRLMDTAADTPEKVEAEGVAKIAAALRRLVLESPHTEAPSPTDR